MSENTYIIHVPMHTYRSENCTFVVTSWMWGFDGPCTTLFFEKKQLISFYIERIVHDLTGRWSTKYPRDLPSIYRQFIFSYKQYPVKKKCMYFKALLYIFIQKGDQYSLQMAMTSHPLKSLNQPGNFQLGEVKLQLISTHMSDGQFREEKAIAQWLKTLC